MAQGPSDTILVAIRITLRIRESKVRNPDPPDRRRFVLSECISCSFCIRPADWASDRIMAVYHIQTQMYAKMLRLCGKSGRHEPARNNASFCCTCKFKIFHSIVSI